MKILFKSDKKVFFIEDDKLDWNYKQVIGGNSNKTPHINELPILYHIIDDNLKYPVYYEYKDRYVIFDNDIDCYTLILKNHNYIIDYTQVNINKLVELL